jgi:membrane protein
VAEVAWRTIRQDQRMAGTVMGAALAYRVFVWALPLALALVGATGLVAAAAGEGVWDLAGSSLGAEVVDSVSAAAAGASPEALLAMVLTGSFWLLYETYALLRAARAVAAFAWGAPIRALRRAPFRVSLFLALILVPVAAGAASHPLAGWLPFPFGLLAALAALAIVPATFVVCTVVLLPHRGGWTAQVPGALLFSAVLAATHLFTTLVVYPWVAGRAAYSVLGGAAVLLITLFILGRAYGLACSLNAVLHRDGGVRTRGTSA